MWESRNGKLIPLELHVPASPWKVLVHLSVKTAREDVCKCVLWGEDRHT